jgi:hypothetical protein
MRELGGSGRRFWSVGAVALGAALLCAAPSVAHAEDAAKASTLAEAAAARGKQGEPRVAIDLYEEAYRAAPRPEYLWEIGAAYDGLASAGDSRDVRLAILYLERYVADAGQSPAHADAVERLTRLRKWKANMRAEPVPPPPPARVPVHLLSYKGDTTYEVALGGTACTTPCTVMVPPGATMLKTRGSGVVEEQIVIPVRPGQIRLQHTDSAGFVAGAVLVPVGITVGASMWALALTCNDSSGCVIANLTIWPVLGVSALVTGIVLLARGRVTPAADANRVEIIGRPGAPLLRFTSAGLAPLAGGKGATAGVGFEF